MSDDKKDLVHPGDLIAAVKGIFGPNARLLDWQVKQGTETVQGFASLMLRAKVKVQDNNGPAPIEREANLMVKRPPTVAAHAAMLNTMGNIVEREALFFNTALPILKERCPELPVVKPLVCHQDAILMEDLCDLGFETLAKNFSDMAKGEVLTYPIARMCFRNLAKLHAASLGTDWRAVMPAGFFDLDTLMEGMAGEQFRMMIFGSIQASIIPLMRKTKADMPDLDKYIEYMQSPQLFANMIPFLKYDEKQGPNLLLHADCHVNNTMYRLDETNKPLDMRFIDFQILRYAPPYTDLVNFLYTGTSQPFRAQHEKDLVRAYVEAFNAAANVTPDLLDFETFYAGFDKARYYGVVFAMGIRPMMLASQFQPEMTEVTEELLIEMQTADKTAPTMNAFENDPSFRREMEELIDHAIQVMKRYVYPE
ncbi:uncharacterized protein LOC132192392 [Neocloeon triangulifer]|uniref:uncharacterized protein LOC132192392 n=1 Tax=Neocloeon triangulifer TaxID=2078957 RepID=UPI00286F115E|nr:uncharacterized protein LOC132192392 [Neocloeon triangulifer]